MFSERTRRFEGLLAGLVAAALLLSLPATGSASEREASGGDLASAGLLAPGAGYGTEAGSKPVRQLQHRLRRLGERPGPVDGLYGPLTEGAVEHFQQAHGLPIDGVVGPQTKGRLLAQRAKQPSARTSSTTQTGRPERKSPAPDHGAESATEPQPRHGAGAELGRADPESSSGLPLPLVALAAALAAALLLTVLRGRGRRAIEARLSLGMVCAALLAVFVIGAAAGALFATRAAPDDGDGRTAQSGALLAARSAPGEAAAPRPAEKARAVVARRPRAKRARSSERARASERARSNLRTPSSGQATASNRVPARAAPPAPDLQPPPVASQAVAPPEPPRAAPVQRAGAAAQRPNPGTYTVRPGDSLWPIAASQLGSESSEERVAKHVDQLGRLNLEGRIASGNPDLIVAGEELRLR